MIKIFELLILKSDTDKAIAALAEATQEFAAQSDGILGFTVQSANPVPARKDIVQLAVPAEVDTFAEFWVADEGTWQSVLDSDPGRRWRAARAAVVEQAATLVTHEHTLIPVPEPRPGCRNNAFLTRNPSLSEEEFLDAWVGEHGKMCLSIPYLRGFVPCKVSARLPQVDVAEMDCAEIEGIAQAYFDNPEEEMMMIATPEAKEWFAHGAITFGLIKAFGAVELAAVSPAAERV